MTRSISTGISPVGIFLNHAVETIFASFLVKGLVDRLIGWAIIGVEFWPIIVLFGRLEFDWYGWIPVGVTRRRTTHSERASARVDAAFSTRAKLLVGAPRSTATAMADGCHSVLSCRYPCHPILARKAHIITTNAPEADDNFGKISTDSYITQILHNLSDAAFDGAWLTAALSQVRFAPGGTCLTLINMLSDSPELWSPDVRRPALFCRRPLLCIPGSSCASDSFQRLVRSSSADETLYVLGRHLARDARDARLAGPRLASGTAGGAERGMKRARLCDDFIFDNK
jgi:hypothetical protein